MNETDVLEQEKTLISETSVEIIEPLYYTIIKRVVDFFCGLIGCVFLLPLIVGIKIACLLTKDTAPIFFKQERIGRNGRPIYIYKFRSMIPNADKALERLIEADEKIRIEYKRYKKLKNDPRITKVGKFIRDTSIDEFPQFINILKGDMSVVGPRPYLFREKEDMGEYYETVIKMKPGLTGYWQVNGRSGTDFVDRLVKDEYYLSHRGVRMDTKIMIKTFSKVLKKEGAK